MFKRMLCGALVCVFALLLGTGALAQEEVLYAGVCDMDLSVREKKQTDARRLDRYEKDQRVEIIELGREWCLVLKGEIQGYVLTRHIRDLESLDPENHPIPEEYQELIAFTPLYRGNAKKNLALRRGPSADSKQVSTVYKEDKLEISEIGPEWTRVRKGKAVGFVLSEFLGSLISLDPYEAQIPGVVVYSYAARVTAPADVMSTQSGDPPVLQQLPVGAVFCTRGPDENGMLPMPYKRTQGMVDARNVALMPVVPYREAQPGDLIGVFSTYYSSEADRAIDQGRLHNIRHGVDFIQDAVIQPEGQFSFNAYAAPYSRGNGYLEGPIINYVSDKKTGYGGGVCQVSTTLYNVLLQLPMRIVTKRPHSAYGIDYAPVDFDAAVGKANLDLVFENKLPYPVTMTFDLADGVVTCLMYRCEE